MVYAGVVVRSKLNPRRRSTEVEMLGGGVRACLGLLDGRWVLVSPYGCLCLCVVMRYLNRELTEVSHVGECGCLCANGAGRGGCCEGRGEAPALDCCAVVYCDEGGGCEVCGVGVWRLSTDNEK